MKVLRVVTLAALVCFSSVASAQDNPQKRNDWSPTTKFLVGEGMVGVSALLASQYPRAFGGLEAVVVPYAAIASSADPKASPVEPWLILVGGGALVVYNLKVDTSKTSASQIFMTNFVGLNVYLGAGLAIAHFRGNSEKGEKVSLAYAPGRYGGNLVLSYRF